VRRDMPTRRRTEHFSSRVLSGKAADGSFLRSNGHAHYLPTAEGDEDPRRLTHVTVYAADGFGSEEVAALSGLRDLALGELKLHTQLVGLGRPTDFRARLLGRGRIWESATPYLAHRHVKRRGQKKDTPYLQGDDPQAAFVELSARELVERRGLGTLLRVESLPPRAGQPKPLEFRRNRDRPGDDGLHRPCRFLRLTFTEPVDGPLCLGHACHFGLGLFLPIDRSGEPGHPW